eukprot:3147480-Rhodomonas_salina.1
MHADQPPPLRSLVALSVKCATVMIDQHSPPSFVLRSALSKPPPLVQPPACKSQPGRCESMGMDLHCSRCACWRPPSGSGC